MSAELKDGDDHAHSQTATPLMVANDQANDVNAVAVLVHDQKIESEDNREHEDPTVGENAGVQHPDAAEQTATKPQAATVDEDGSETKNDSYPIEGMEVLAERSGEGTNGFQTAEKKSHEPEFTEEAPIPLTEEVISPHSPSKAEESDMLKERLQIGLDAIISESIEVPTHSNSLIVSTGSSPRLKPQPNESETSFQEIETPPIEESKQEEQNDLINTRLALGLEHPPHIELPPEVLERSASVVPIPPSTPGSATGLEDLSDQVREQDDATPTKEQGDPIPTDVPNVSIEEASLEEGEIPVQNDEEAMLNARLELGLEAPVHAHIPPGGLGKSVSVATVPASTPRVEDFVSDETTPELETSEPGAGQAIAPLTEENLKVEDQDLDVMLDTRLELGLDYPVHVEVSNKVLEPTASDISIPPSTPLPLNDTHSSQAPQDYEPPTQPLAIPPPAVDGSELITELKEENLPDEEEKETLLERRLELALDSPKDVAEPITLPEETESAVALPASTPPTEVTDSEPTEAIISNGLEGTATGGATSSREQSAPVDEGDQALQESQLQPDVTSHKIAQAPISSLDASLVPPTPHIDEPDLEPARDIGAGEHEASALGNSSDVAGDVVSLREANLPVEDDEKAPLEMRLDLGSSLPVAADVSVIPLDKTTSVTSIPASTPQATDINTEDMSGSSLDEDPKAVDLLHVAKATDSQNPPPDQDPSPPQQEIETPSAGLESSPQEVATDDRGFHIGPSVATPVSDTVAESTATVKPSTRPEAHNELEKPITRVVGFEGNGLENSASPSPLQEQRRPESFTFDTPDGSDHYEGFLDTNSTVLQPAAYTAPGIAILQAEDSPPPQIVSSMPRDGIMHLIPIKIQDANSEKQLRPEAQRLLSTTPEAPTSPRSESFDETSDHSQQVTPVVRRREIEPMASETAEPQTPSVSSDVPQVEITSPDNALLSFVDDARSERSVATSVEPIAPNSPRFISPMPTPSLDSTHFMLEDTANSSQPKTLIKKPAEEHPELEYDTAELVPELKDALSTPIERSAPFKLEEATMPMQPQLAPVTEDGVIDAPATASIRHARPRHTSTPSTWSINRASGWYQSGSHAKDPGRPSLEIASGEFSRPPRSAPPEYPSEVGQLGESKGSKEDDGRCIVF